MKNVYMAVSKVTGLRKQCYGWNELDAIQQLQKDDDRWPLGTFAIRQEKRKEMRS